MAEELKALKMERAAMKGQITRFKSYFEGEEQNDIQLQLRLEKVYLLYDKFQEVQTRIEIIDESETETNERDRFENNYFEIISKVRKYLGEKEEKASTNETASNKASTQNVKLPTITLPTFEGNYEQWLLFKDSFTSVIDSNDNLNELQKFQYLRGSLKGEALSLISGLETTARNYKVAWDLLQKRYQNKRLIINTHIKGIVEAGLVSKENHNTLRQFVDGMQKHLRALEALEQPVEEWNTLLVYLITGKIDYYTRREWETINGKKNVDVLPTTEELMQFLTNRCNMLEMMEKNKTQEVVKTNTRRIEKQVNLVATTTNACNYCAKQDHAIYKCETFIAQPIEKRIEEAKRLKLCLNCLKSGHFAKQCKSSHCRQCSRYHNSLLHLEASQHSEESSNSTSQEEKPAVATHFAQGQESFTLLATAQVYVCTTEGRMQECRVLLDPGSQVSFVTSELCKRLKIPVKEKQVTIGGINETISNASKQAHVKIKSRFNNYHAVIPCLVVPTITGKLPQLRLDINQLRLPENIQWADPEFYTPNTIDLLIGAELFWNLLSEGQIKLSKRPNSPVLQNTKLGWVISGTVISSKITSKQLCYFAGFANLEAQIEQFWETEEIVQKQLYSEQEKQCEKHFVENVERDEAGRFIVALPGVQPERLGESLKTAMRRLNTLERRLEQDVELKNEYHKFLNEYEEMGHMKRVSTEVENTKKGIYYLPHHPIVKEDSLTTKLRVVFDASAKTTTGLSLNDILLVGPKIQDDLFDIVIRFRTYPIVLTADIAMMYRQIKIKENDKRLQRICWRRDPNEDISIYELQTVTYGTASAPFLATRCLKQLSEEVEQSFPAAAKAIRRDFYMDDLLTGADNQEEAIRLRQQLSESLSQGGFYLRKWRSNEPTILQEIKENNITDDSLLVLNKDGAIKTLGINWDARTDTLQYTIRLNKDQQFTKRAILAKIAKIFDPLGLVGPIITTAKLIMQQLWQIQLDWDEPVPQHIVDIWTTYYDQLETINEFKVERKVRNQEQGENIELHGFCDASEKAYGACVYIKAIETTGNNIARLLCSKSRVAPLKNLSLPRLELNGAVLLAKLVTSVKRAIGDKIKKIYLWTDSTIVLAWINTQPNQLKTFAANRVAEIQRLTEPDDWRHVPSKTNPADIVSRGSTPKDLLHNNLWWQGPEWLTKQEWPSLQLSYDQEAINKESKPKTVTAGTLTTLACERFSTFEKMKRVIAFCKRFSYNSRNNGNRKIDAFTVDELEAATRSILLWIQRETFPQDIKELEAGRQIAKGSKLLTLNPFIDACGLLRVGGRLRHASIDSDHKNPKIGDLVLLVEDNLPAIKWSIGRITQQHPGADGVVRVVTVKTKSGVFKRPTKRLCVLPNQD